MDTSKALITFLSVALNGKQTKTLNLEINNVDKLIKLAKHHEVISALYRGADYLAVSIIRGRIESSYYYDIIDIDLH